MLWKRRTQGAIHRAMELIEQERFTDAAQHLREREWLKRDPDLHEPPIPPYLGAHVHPLFEQAANQLSQEAPDSEAALVLLRQAAGLVHPMA